MEEKAKATEAEEKKGIMKLPKEEQLPWALLTGAYILFASGLLAIMQGLDASKGATAQIILYVSAILAFAVGGYLMHCYHRWLVRQ
jgi:uncharacterized membrane-anchored protein